LLKYHNELIAIAKLPAEDQGEPLVRLHRSSADEAALVRAFAPPAGKIGDAHRRTLARLRSAMTIIALERFRLMHGHWPDALAELTPQLLAKPVLDPFAKTPLRMKHLPDGVVTYSVGADGRDDDGDVDANHPGTPGLDIGFRLWNPDNRRQPPPNAEEKNP
jgi:hypothetical protein